MSIALPMFTNVSIDWKLRSCKIPPSGPPSSQDLRDLFFKAIRSQKLTFCLYTPPNLKI